MTDAPTRLLLPHGMRDLVPDEARARRGLARRLLEHVASYGYALVVPPAFELAEVLERGMSPVDREDIVRFPLPETGDIAALRPDMTPQLARMIATRLSAMPPPLRLAYEGTVIRRRKERARKHRQVAQSGIELAGPAAPEGDLEVLDVALGALPALGVDDFVLDLSHAGIVRALLAAYPDARALELAAALAAKDAALVSALAAGAPAAITRAMGALPRLSGPVTVLDEAEPWLRDTPAAPHLAALRALVEALGSARPGTLQIDLGEARGFAYYTGAFFRLYAEGPGEALGGGGRYDELLARFGRPLPAVGFALDLDHVGWARRVRGVTEPPARVLACVGVGQAIVAALRTAGLSVATSPDEAHARAWAHSDALVASGARLALVSLDASRASCEAPSVEPGAVVAWLLRTLPRRDQGPA